MKKILKLLFEERMYRLEEEAFWETIHQRRMQEKNYYAEKALKSLGYVLVFDSTVKKQPSEVTHWKDMGWKLVKEEHITQ